MMLMHHRMLPWVHRVRRKAAGKVWGVMGWVPVVMLRVRDGNIDWDYCARRNARRNLNLHAFDNHHVPRKE